MMEEAYRAQEIAIEELRKQVEIGRHAQVLLGNPVAEAFFSSTQEALLVGAEKIIDNTKSTEYERDAILRSIVFFRRFKRFVEYTLEDGKVSEDQLRELTKTGKTSFLGGIV